MYVELNMDFNNATEFIRLNEILQGRPDILVSLFMNDINTVKDLLKYGVEGLLNLGNISLFNIAIIKQKLNEQDYHLKGEEIVDYDDYLDKEREEPLKCCDVIVKKKRELQKRIIAVEIEIETMESDEEDSSLLIGYQNYLEELNNLEKDLDYAFETLINYVREKREEKMSLNK